MHREAVGAAHSNAGRTHFAVHWLWLLSAFLVLVAWLGPSRATPAQAPFPAGLQWVTQATLRSATDEGAATQSVKLSNAWNAVDRSGTWVYQASFTGPDTPATWGLYIPRIGNRAQISLNGWAVGQLGALAGDSSDFAQRPHFFHLPEAALRSGTNTLQLTVQGERARYAGLSLMAVGPLKDTQALYFKRDLVQTQGSFAIVLIASIFALASTALLVVSRERAYLLFALACFFCAVRTSYALVIDTAPLDYRAWTWIVDTSFGGYLVCLSLFCLEVVKIRRRWAWVITAVLIALTAILVPMHAFGRLAWARQLWTMGLLIYSTCFSVALVYHWWRTPTTATRVLGVAGLLAVSIGLYDHVLVFYSADGFGAFALTRYSLLLFMVAMAVVLVNHHAGQHQREIALRHQLQDELAVKTAELVSQFKTQAQLIATMAQARERERLVHDLHDGIGLQLHTLLSMAEGSGTGSQNSLVDRRADSRADLLSEVRTAIEQMRMLVDNSQSFEGTWQELLGHVRHRIESRLLRAGVQLQWQMELPDAARAASGVQAVALQHLMFELTTNVIKHAGAKTMTVRIATTNAGSDLDLKVTDDGVGFDALQITTGGGSRSMRRRIQELQGKTEAGHGGKTCHITFPML